MRAAIAWALLGSALVIPFLAACQGQPAPSEPQPATLPAKQLGVRMPLASYIPAPGLRWLVQLKPRALVEDVDVRKDWEPVFSSQRIAAFRSASGFDPSQVEEIWIAGYDLGTLYLFDATRVGSAAESAFRERSLTTAELSTRKDDLVHLTGMRDQVPHSLIHLDHYFIGIAEGDIRLTKIVAAYAEGRLTKTPSALQTHLAKPLADFAPEAKVRAFALGPFTDATDAVVSGLVSGAIGVDLQQEELRLSAKSLGVWPRDNDLEEHLGKWLSDIFATAELRALGWGSPINLSAVACTGSATEPDISECTATGTWNSAQIALATHRITASTMEEIVNGPPPTNATEAAPDSNPSSTHRSGLD